jgi:ribosome-associated protein
MSRKFRKGYFVDGEFIVAGSEADQKLRSELEDAGSPSRTKLKNASEKLQKLGEQLLALPEDWLLKLSLPEALNDAIFDAKRISKLGARRRQTKLVGKLMRRLEPEALEAVSTALRVANVQSGADARLLHRAEKWRDALIADDKMLEQWVQEFPRTDAQQLRSLIRQERKEAKQADPGEARRHGGTYRQILIVLRSQLSFSADDPPD